LVFIMSIKISPSILSADFCNLATEITNLQNAKADYLHIDVMDGNFVPNITIGQPVIKAIKKIAKIPLDVHLMIQNPSQYIKEFAEIGSDIITIHPESEVHIERALTLIRSCGKRAGLALCPSTNENILQYLLPKIDQILIMTVNPGFSGQEFIESQIQKIKNVKQIINNSTFKVDLQVDGGINEKTAKTVINAGANVLVSGKYIFDGDYAERIKTLKQ
jgi:ribulose-phosphate 3-epimerase